MSASLDNRKNAGPADSGAQIIVQPNSSAYQGESLNVGLNIPVGMVTRFDVSANNFTAPAPIEKTKEAVVAQDSAISFVSAELLKQLDKASKDVISALTKAVNHLRVAEAFSESLREKVSQSAQELVKTVLATRERSSDNTSASARAELLEAAVESVAAVRREINAEKGEGVKEIKSSLTRAVTRAKVLHRQILEGSETETQVTNEEEKSAPTKQKAGASVDTKNDRAAEAVRTVVHDVVAPAIDPKLVNPLQLAIASVSKEDVFQTMTPPPIPDFMAAKREKQARVASEGGAPAASKEVDRTEEAVSRVAPALKPTAVAELTSKLIGEVKDFFASDAVASVQTAAIDKLEGTVSRLRKGIETAYDSIKDLLSPEKNKRLFGFLSSPTKQNKELVSSYKESIAEVEAVIKERLDERRERTKLCVERVREQFANREFTVSKENKKEIPALLLKASIPAEKFNNGSLITFGQLATLRKQFPDNIKVNQGKRTITLSKNGRNITFLDRGDGRVTVFDGKERKGVAWTDDALKGAKKFLETGSVGYNKKTWPDRIVPPADYFVRKGSSAEALARAASVRVEPKVEVQPEALVRRALQDDSKKLAS